MILRLKGGWPTLCGCAKGGIPKSKHREILILIFTPPAECLTYIDIIRAGLKRYYGTEHLPLTCSWYQRQTSLA